MKVKTQDLTEVQLDWAVAKCLNWEDYNEDGVPYIELDSSHMSRRFGPYKPSTDWEQAGPIINREITRLFKNVAGGWTAQIHHEKDHPLVAQKVTIGWTSASGPTSLVAAMRCYVANILGNEIEIPEKIIKT